MLVIGETSVLDSEGVLPEKEAERVERHPADTSSTNSDESCCAGLQIEQDRNESAALIETLFSPLSASAERCTFGTASKNLKLKDAHIRKVVKYANRRLEKMNWSLLMEQFPMHRECDEMMLPSGLKHKEAKLGDLLGEGSFSTVYKRKKHPEHVIKILRKKMMHNPAMLAACAADLVKEGWILAALHGSDYVIKIHGWQENGLHTLNNGFHDGFFLILERLECTLGDKIKEWQHKKSKLSNPFNFRKKNGMTNGEAKLELLKERLAVVPQVAQGIGAMHKLGLIHRDLKPDNIGLGLDGKWKIFDLDVGRICPTKNTKHYCTKSFKLTKRVGSPRYMSPECAKGMKYNCLTDVYSFSLIVHELITLLKPYDEVPSELHDQQIFYEHYRPLISHKWPFSMKCFLERAWDKDWRLRPDFTLESFQSSLARRILPDFVEYKHSRYCARSSFFSRKKKSLPQRLQASIGKSARSQNAKGHIMDDEIESSFSTLFTGSFRADSRDMSPTFDGTHVLSV